MSFIEKLINIVFKNWSAKIVSVLLALSIWVYIGIGQTKTANFPGGIPLQIKNVPQSLVAITDVEKVTVKLIADSAVWKKLSADSFKAEIDLAGQTEGNHELKVNISVNVADVQIVETQPSKISVRLEPMITKEVAVNVLVDGKAGEGLVPGQWKAEPSSVKASGPKSIINSLNEVVAKIHLDGQAADFKKVAKLEGFDAQGKMIGNITLLPQESTISVPIVKASNIKTVGIKAALVGMPAAGYWITEVKVSPQTVTISASDSMINNINFIKTTDINIGGLSKNLDTNVSLKQDQGINILDDIAQVKVSISVAKNQISKELSIGFSWQNLAENLKVSRVEPSTVKVLVLGPQDVLAKLTSGDVSLAVDLANVSEAGEQIVDISRANLLGPTGTSVSSIVPSSVKVKVENK